MPDMFTTSDLTAINSAISSGHLTVKTADGKLITLRSVAELLKAKQAIEAEIASTATTQRAYPRHMLASFRG